MANQDDLLFQAGIDINSFKQDADRLRKEILGVGDVGSDIKIDFGLTKENIRIQKQVIAEIEANIKAIRDKAAGMAPGLAQAGVLAEIAPLKAELKAEEEALIALQTELGQTAEKYESLVTLKNRAINEMQRLTLANQQGTAEYAKAEAEVQKYSEAIDETNRKVSVLRQGGFASMINSLSAVSGGLSAGVAALGLFGGKEEKLNEIMLKSQALLGVATTLQSLYTAEKSKSGIMSGVLAVQEMARAKATDIGTAATGRATVAQRLWNLVANANPYVLLATAILSVVGAIGLYISATNEATKKAKEQAEFNKKLADSVAEPLVQYRLLQAQWNALGDDLKAKEKFINDNKDAFKELGTSVNNVSDAENVFRNNSSAFVEAMMLRAKAAVLAQQAIENMKKSIELEKEYRRKNISGDTTVWEDLSRLTPAARRAKSRAEAEEVRKAKQADIDLANEQLKVEKELAALNKRAGFKAPGSGKTAKTTSSKPKTREEVRKDSPVIKTLEEEIEEIRKMTELRDKLLQQGYSKEQVDKMFPKIKDTSYLTYLEDLQNKLRVLVESGKGNNETASAIVKIQEEIDALNNRASKLDIVSERIENLKSKFSGADLLQRLDTSEEKSLIDASEREVTAIRKIYDNARKEAIEAQQDKFNALLKEQQTYQEKSDALTREWEEMRAMAGTDAEREKIDKLFSNRQGKLDMEMIQETAEWQVAFSELEGMSETSLQAILARLLEFQEKSKGTLTLSDAAELQKAIDNVNRAANKNPFAKLSSTFANYRTSLKAAKKAQDDYNQAQEEFGKGSKEAVAAAEKAIEADKKSLDAKKALIGQLQEGQNIFNAVGEGVMELTDAFGGMDDATKDAVGNIMEIGNAAMDLGKSIASGNIAGMISAGIKLIASIGKALSGDQRKERAIKRQAAALKELETRYNELAFAAERAFGAAKYDGQRDLIRNLEQQKIAIEAMMRTESSKKKADKGKIADYKAQITQINQSITELKEGIIKDVLQTEIPDMAAKIGDALLDAFGKGEDGVRAVNAAFDDMVKNIMRNQLNKILEEQMKPVYDSLLKASGLNADGTGTFDGFTEAELKDLREKYLNASKIGQEFIKGYSEIFKDLQSPDVQGIKGDIKGVTEKTAGALEAQINAMRINQVSGLEVMRNSLLNLVRIEENTRRLHNIDKNIQELNAKTKNNLAGVG